MISDINIEGIIWKEGQAFNPLPNDLLLACVEKSIYAISEDYIKQIATREARVAALVNHDGRIMDAVGGIIFDTKTGQPYHNAGSVQISEMESYNGTLYFTARPPSGTGMSRLYRKQEKMSIEVQLAKRGVDSISRYKTKKKETLLYAMPGHKIFDVFSGVEYSKNFLGDVPYSLCQHKSTMYYLLKYKVSHGRRGDKLNNDSNTLFISLASHEGNLLGWTRQGAVIDVFTGKEYARIPEQSMRLSGCIKSMPRTILRGLL